MALIRVQQLSVSFGGHPLLDDVTFHLERGERVCLLGRNGTGKTTLLRMIAGLQRSDSGEVIRVGGTRVAMLPQQVPDDISGTCLDLVQGAIDSKDDVDPRTHRAQAVISRMGLDEGAEVSTLSGGRKRRVMLARALVNDPDVLLLDEPSNHLDIESILWLESFLLRFEGGLLLISHDRQLIRRLATRILDIDIGRLTSWSGGYDDYLRRKAEALAVEERQQAEFGRLLAKEEVWIRQGIQARRTRNEGRVRNLLKLRQEAKERRMRSGTVDFQIQRGDRTSRRVVEIRGATVSFDGNPPLFQPLDLTVYRGDRIGIIGPNGCGKTTLLRLMLGDQAPQSGEVIRGDNLQIAYLDQLRFALDDDRTVAWNVSGDTDSVLIDGRTRHINAYLNDFLFTTDRANSPVRVLSGGERHRLLLARLFTHKANVLVLDEPTNDLDLETLELLEDRIQSFAGTVLIVSHDRAFLNNTVTSTLVFEDDKWVEYAGGYDDWLSQRPETTRNDAERSTAGERKLRTRTGDTRRKLSNKETRELETLPERITELEREQQALSDRINDPTLYVNQADQVAEITKRLEQIEFELMAALERWESLETLRDSGR